MLNTIIKHIIRFIPGFFATAFAFVSVFTAAPERLETMINQQVERIEALETAYKNGLREQGQRALRSVTPHPARFCRSKNGAPNAPAYKRQSAGLALRVCEAD